MSKRPSIVAAAARANWRGRRRWGAPILIAVTDPVRLPDPAAVAARLNRGAGRSALVIVRHALDRDAAAGLRRTARRQHVAVLHRWVGARSRGPWHLPDRPGRARVAGARTAAAHGVAAARRQRGRGAPLILLSPVLPTASHPGAAALGPVRWALMARRIGAPVIALGGVRARDVARLAALGAAGVAAIDGWRDAWD